MLVSQTNPVVAGLFSYVLKNAFFCSNKFAQVIDVGHVSENVLYYLLIQMFRVVCPGNVSNTVSQFVLLKPTDHLTDFTKFQSLLLSDLSRFNYQTFTPETRSSISLMIINIPFCREQSMFTHRHLCTNLCILKQLETRFKPFNLNLTVITANQFGRRCFTHPNDFMTFHGD